MSPRTQHQPRDVLGFKAPPDERDDLIVQLAAALRLNQYALNRHIAKGESQGYHMTDSERAALDAADLALDNAEQTVGELDR